jgi:hypothetical protein
VATEHKILVRRAIDYNLGSSCHLFWVEQHPALKGLSKRDWPMGRVIAMRQKAEIGFPQQKAELPKIQSIHLLSR